MSFTRPLALFVVALAACSAAADGDPSSTPPTGDAATSSPDAAGDAAVNVGLDATTTDSDSPPVGDGAVNPLHPNEPAGFAAFAQSPCDQLPPLTTGAVTGWTGQWGRQPSGNLTMDSDPTAPRSPPGVIKTRFPQTLTGGSGPVSFGGWDIAGNAIAGRKKKVYWHAFYKIVDSGGGYENHPGPGTKQGWFGYGDDPNAGDNQGFPMLMQSLADPRIDTKFKMALYTQGPPAGPNDPDPHQNVYPNVDKSFTVTVGVWHSWEIVLEINDPDKSNGVLKMWWDGKLTIDRSDLHFRNTLHANSFFHWRWNPTYGGGPTTKTRDDFMMFDDIYMSGMAGQ